MPRLRDFPGEMLGSFGSLFQKRLTHSHYFPVLPQKIYSNV